MTTPAASEPVHTTNEPTGVDPIMAAASAETALPPQRSDHGSWASPVSSLTVSDAPAHALNRNVTGRQVLNPAQGFGKMWQKTYQVRVPGTRVTPTELIAEWKANFPKFWPPKNDFYGALTGIAPGDVALLNLTMPGRVKLSTGVLVIYADDESFSFMAPQGHMFAGIITFSSFAEEGTTVAQVQILLRAQDPLYEVGLMMGGHRKEDRFWQHTLAALAAHFGVEADVDTTAVVVDKKRQWRRARNIWYNAAIRTAIYVVTAPARWVAKPFRRRPRG